MLLFPVLLMLAPLPVHSTGKLTAYTVNYPLRYFAERIGGDRVDVHFPAPKDIDPAFWSPNAETIAAYQKAELIILNGANYAKWVSKVALPRLQSVDSSAAFADQLITEKDVVTHSHGPRGDHSHSGTAFTTWLDFNQAAQQAEEILKALQRKRPEDSEFFAQNFNKLKQDLQSLDTEMLSLSGKATDRQFIASHPVYQYLTRRYRLNLAAMTWEPDEFPSQEQWQQFSRTLQKNSARWMLWEDKPLEKTEQTLLELGVTVVLFAPSMNVPEDGDFLAIMQQNVENLKGALESGLEQDAR
jgi:zinc transport system substrate-binding protein